MPNAHDLFSSSAWSLFEHIFKEKKINDARRLVNGSTPGSYIPGNLQIAKQKLSGHGVLLLTKSSGQEAQRQRGQVAIRDQLGFPVLVLTSRLFEGSERETKLLSSSTFHECLLTTLLSTGGFVDLSVCRFPYVPRRCRGCY